MDKQTIKNRLEMNHQSFIDYVLNLTKDNFLFTQDAKWSAGQQLEHIYLGVKPVRQVLSLPKFLLTLFWGKSNKQSNNYDDLIKKYLLKLENGGRATGRFIPKTVTIEKAHTLKIKLTNEVMRLICKLDKFTENELDTYVLPHPLLGKLTLREMLFFTIYHVNHHEELTKRYLNR